MKKTTVIIALSIAVLLLVSIIFVCLINYPKDKKTTNKETGTDISKADDILSVQTEMNGFDTDVFENRSEELVFSASIDDFIDSFNKYYSNDKQVSYLTPSNEWRRETISKGIHSNHQSEYYYFSEDENIWSLPTISVYTPTNAAYIQEVTVNYDWHSHSESTYDIYNSLCFYTLKVFFSELSDQKIIELYTEVNNLGYKNMFSEEERYSYGSIPYILFFKDNIAVYPYFVLGSWQNLCIIPVTEEALKEFDDKGTKIVEIE